MRFIMSHLSHFFTKIIQKDFSGGLFLIIISAIAILLANSPLDTTYFGFLKYHFFGLSILLWINDGLMSLFFLIVGLEIKRELIAGQLATKQQRILPTLSALGGMIFPAIIYLFININYQGIIKGWAIPTATDIAFSLGVLSLLGSRVPMSLKIFLTALAIIDDLGAVVIIALFYTSTINIGALLIVIGITALLLMINRLKVNSLLMYLVLGLILWFFMLQSGIHATIAGVLLALFIPFRQNDSGVNIAITLENNMHYWVTFLIIPLFGFANAGVSLTGISFESIAHPVTLGVMLGLFLGKQIGVFLFSYIPIKLGVASLPRGANYLQLYGVSTLCGVGFTMSLFIGLLAFPTETDLQNATKIGVIFGSLFSSLIGAFALTISKK